MLSDRLWEIGDIVKLVEDAEAAPGAREFAGCEPVAHFPGCGAMAALVRAL